MKYTWIGVLFLLALLLFPLPGVDAQAQTSLEKLKVDLWPEYDQSGVLVIYAITLPAQVSLPADVFLRIPEAVGKPNAVAARQSDGTLVTIDYQQQVSGEWSLLQIKAPAPELQVEFYDQRLTREGNIRRFEYRWPGDLSVRSLMVQVQQPREARNMRIIPNLGGVSTHDDGLIYYSSDLGALGTGQTFTLTFSYEKDSEALSSSTLPVEASAPIQRPSGTSLLLSMLPWLLGALGMTLLFGGGLWYWQIGRIRSQSGLKRRHRAVTAREVGSVAASEENLYCHQCGNRAAAGDRFCRICGTQLRLGGG